MTALDVDVAPIIADFRRKHNYLYDALAGHYEITRPGGAFYLYPKAPWGTGTEFVQEAIRHNLLMIPGITFGRRDTHFRVSYAATDEKLKAGVDILMKLARR